MKIPLVNAIFDGELNIDEFFLNKKNITENLVFKKVNKKIFPSVKLIKYMNQYYSAPIIVNCANEILVDHFLAKKIHFLDINKIIFAVLRDGNFRKFALKKPVNINEIYQINNWAKTTTMKKLNQL